MDPQINPQQTVSGISGGGELSLYQYFVASPLFAGFNDFGGVDRKLFLSEYAGMSLSLKNYLSSTETATSITTVGLNYQLDDSQVYHMATLVRELIIGKIFIKDFPITISSKLGIDDIKAGEIANKIISKSFGPIIEDIKRIQRSKFPDKIAQMQKESRPSELTLPQARRVGEARPEGAAQPAGITQPTARVDLPKPQPKPEIEPRGEVQPQRPDIGQSVRPPQIPKIEVRPQSAPLQPQPSPLRSVESIQPPQQMSRSEDRGSSIAPQSGPPRLEVPPQRPEVGLQKQPEVQLQKPAPRPQFKIPNLGQPIVREDLPQVVRENPPQATVPRSDLQGSTNLESADAQKSLEQELEKVAGVIDLRNKPNS